MKRSNLKIAAAVVVVEVAAEIVVSLVELIVV